MLAFAERLKQARLAKGLTKSELGSKIGVHYSQVGRYEEKGAHPSADALSKIANVLEVSSDYLMNGTPDDLANSSLSDKELLNQFKIIEKLPELDRSVVKIFLDAFITKNKLKQMVM
jgi:transcriptional regulator with XRE-family HTH domain